VDKLGIEEMGSAHETEYKVRLRAGEDRSAKRNALESDDSVFRGDTDAGRPALLLNRIAFAPDIGLYAGDVRADLCDGLVDLGLAAAGDKHVGALFNEPLGGREADAAAAAGDDGNLVFQLRHVVSFSVRARRQRRRAAGAPGRSLPQHL